jgi:predicted O-methyltransferase YrrM
MSVKTLFLNDCTYRYMLDVSLREHPVLRELREATGRTADGGRQISPEQGQLMALLAEMIGATTTLEIGTFHGYSALAVALALPPGGRVVTCDMDARHLANARRFWAKAGVDGKIEFKHGIALDTLDALVADGQRGRFDLAFIDANEEEHDAYYERSLVLIRRGGVIVLDNIFVQGLAAGDPERGQPVGDRDAVRTAAVRELNAKLLRDERVSITSIPLSDGIMLARKR